MRAKFKVDHVDDYGVQVIAYAAPVCEDGIPENKRFNKYTPFGKLEISITNPDAMGFLQPGKSYYLDFTEVTDEPAS